MKKFVLTLAAALSIAGASATHTADYRVIPLPRTVELNASEKAFPLLPTTKIFFNKDDQGQRRNAELLQGYIKELTGLELAIVTRAPRANYIHLRGYGYEGATAGGYTLTVSERAIVIDGADAEGTFHGIQTLRKAIGDTEGDADIQLPAACVTDAPEFGYRGMHLDVSRHFMTADSVKQYIDMLALHNINRFHWHLTDDQGWRIEIKKHPRLTEVGSRRAKTVIGKNWGTYDNIPHEGYYTQEQIRDIVSYAADRHITIIPEIDLPGHMQGVLAAYPELGCTGGPYEVWPTWGVSDDVLCVGNEKTFSLLEDVLAEVMELFPSEYIHIGGDECPKTRWKDCPKCQAKIASLGIKGDDQHSAEEYLQSYVIKRMEKFINARGRRIIGWDEILEGGVSPTATVMSWRGEEGGRAAAKMGNQVVMVPNNYFYFDYYQTEDTRNEPLAIGGCVTLEHVYDYNPHPEGLTPEEQARIIGVQANLWTEYVPTFRQVQYMVLPRMAALSEVQWSDPESRDFADFTARLFRLMKLYDKFGYNYARHIFSARAEFTPNNLTGGTMVKLFTVDNSPIRYTLDGTMPTASSTLYTAPFEIHEDCHLVALSFPADGGKTQPVEETFSYNKATNRAITLAYPTHSNYTYKGASTLVDGMRGVANIRTGRWLGWCGDDMVATIDLGSDQEISRLQFDTFVDRDDWVFNTRGYSLEVSTDGREFTPVVSKDFEPATQESESGIITFSEEFSPVTCRYARLTVKCEKVLPQWHGGHGKPAFVFVDEISLN
jgi:hexosaminidase